MSRHLPSSGRLETIVEVEPGDAGTRLNDGRCDSRGRLWIGTMDAAIEKPLGSFYRVDADGRAHWLFGDIIVTNSVAISRDGQTLYMSDTGRFKLWAFDLDGESGVISNRRVFVDYEGQGGRPDCSNRRCSRRRAWRVRCWQWRSMFRGSRSRCSVDARADESRTAEHLASNRTARAQALPSGGRENRPEMLLSAASSRVVSSRLGARA